MSGPRNVPPLHAAGPRPGCRSGGKPAEAQRRSLWPDEASANRALAVPLRVASDADGTSTTRASSRCSPRAVREVEAAAQRGPVMPSVRTKFQVVALLVREERASVKADLTIDRGPPRRAAQAPRRRRDDPREDRGPRHLAPRAARRGRRHLRRGEVAQARHAERRRRRGGPRGDRAGVRWPSAERPSAGSCRSRSSRASWPTPSSPPTSRPPPPTHGAPAPARQLGAARPALQVLRDGRQRSLGLHGPARADLPAGTARTGADAAPGAGGRGRRRRPPDLPARRRARARQDGAGAARRPGGERLPAARGRPERRQDQLGPRGRAVDARTGRPP